ncbi:MAG: Oxoglutarate dehydrogenase inhibitor [Myxococcaceae bacterium]|nr:Oxoglutarate dehydrogenase inhibitor [Myxococcaceae bacterium]
MDQVSGEITLVPQDGHGVQELRTGRQVPFIPPYPPSKANEALTEGVPHDELAARLPTPIAAAYSRALAASHAGTQCHLVAEVFSTFLRYSTLVMVSDYLAAADLRDPNLDELLRVSLHTPTPRTWLRILRRAIRVFEGGRRTPFCTGLPAAFERLQRRNVLLRRNQITPGGDMGEEVELTDPLTALIDFTETMSRGYTPSGDVARERSSGAIAALRAVLQAATFLTDNPLRWTPPKAPRRSVVSLMGLTPIPALENLPESSNASAVYLRASDGAGFLSLPLVVEVRPSPSDGTLLDDILLFDSYEDNRISYRKLSGEPLSQTLTTSSWPHLLASKRRVSVSGSLETMSLEEVLEIADEATRARIAALRAEGTVPSARRTVVGRTAHHELEGFITAQIDAPTKSVSASAYRGALIIGPAGTGKTTLLSRVAEEHLGRDLVVYYSASTLENDDLMTLIAETLRVVRQGTPLGFGELLGRLAAPMRSTKARLVIVIDAIEEFRGGPRKLLKAVQGLIASLATSPWARVVVSMRDSAWNHAVPADLQRGLLSSFCALEMGNFSEEEFERAYHYLQLGGAYERSSDPAVPSSPTTSIDTLRNLPRELRTVLHHPLTLRLLAERFDQRSFSLTFLREDAARERFERLTREETEGMKHSDCMQAIADQMAFILRDCVTRTDLASSPVFRDMFAGHETNEVPYVLAALVSSGALASTKNAGETFYRFAQPLLFEHVIAQRHAGRVHDGRTLCALAARWAKESVFRELIPAVMLQLCRGGRPEHVLDAIDQIPISGHEAILDAATTTFVRLGVAEDDRFNALLTAAVARPTEADLVVLTGAAERLLHLAVPTVLLRLLDALAPSGDLRNLTSVRPDLDRRRLLVLARTRRALEQLTRAEQALAELEGPSESGAIRPDPEVLVERAWLTRARGQREAAARILDRLDATAGDLPPDSEARISAHRLRAQLAIDAGDRELARPHILDAIERARQRGAQRELCLALLQRTWMEWLEGDLKLVDDLLTEALPIAEQTGHLDLLRQCLGYRAIERREVGAYREAVVCAERQLAVARHGGQNGPMQAALRNLGVFRLEAGDLAGAESALRESAELARRLRRAEAELGLLLTLAVVEREGQGGRDRALATVDWALTVAARERVDPHQHLWLRWMITRAPSDAVCWQAAAPDKDRLFEAHRATLSLDEAIRRGEVGDLRPAFESLVPSIASARPRPELYELPMGVAGDAVRVALAEQDTTLARFMIEHCRTWLNGRPSTDFREMQGLLEQHLAAGDRDLS